MSYQTYILTFDSKDSARSVRSSLPENKIFDTEEELLRRLKEIHEGEFGPLNPGDATVEVNSMYLGDFDTEPIWRLFDPLARRARSIGMTQLTGNCRGNENPAVEDIKHFNLSNQHEVAEGRGVADGGHGGGDVWG